MSNSRHLVDNISQITSHRDIELLAFSVLKSIQQMLSPINTCIVKYDGNNNAIFEMGIKDEQQYLVTEDLNIPSDINDAITFMTNQSLNDYTFEEGSLTTYFYHLQQNKLSNDFLYVKVQGKLNKEQVYVISGILSIYANHLALLLESQMDALTGLANRRSFDDTIVQLFNQPLLSNDIATPERRIIAPQKRYWLAVIDIDDFKMINDNYGHLYGDEVLIVFGQKLRSSFRASDLKFRFGGEEFIVILDCPKMEDCKRKLDSFRAEIENTVFPNNDTVTASIGVVEINPDTFHVTLIDQADQALYLCKKEGKNRVYFYADLVESGAIKAACINSGDIQLF